MHCQCTLECTVWRVNLHWGSVWPPGAHPARGEGISNPVSHSLRRAMPPFKPCRQPRAPRDLITPKPLLEDKTTSDAGVSCHQKLWEGHYHNKGNQNSKNWIWRNRISFASAMETRLCRCCRCDLLSVSRWTVDCNTDWFGTHLKLPCITLYNSSTFDWVSQCSKDSWEG